MIGVQSNRMRLSLSALIITSGPIPLMSPTEIPTRTGVVVTTSFSLCLCSISSSFLRSESINEFHNPFRHDHDNFVVFPNKQVLLYRNEHTVLSQSIQEIYLL